MTELTSSATHTIIRAVKERREVERSRMGREFASGFEAWAKIKRELEIAKSGLKAVETLQTDVWTAIREDNDDSVTVHLAALGNQALELCVKFVAIAAEAQRAAEELRERL